ncbi:hypothetical protein [Paenibacillus camelliae]|uniref:hypothetical protein n=1 Tax=Paenibacillus camelliae TaxID=512410 RepID=UPI00203F0E8F|nr:hypothetical protein [Paenibacillus camelliae]MCM3632952.1 hypothetical protein [Paenibacillus camelliae]
MKYKVFLYYSSQETLDKIVSSSNKDELVKELSRNKFVNLGGTYYNMDLVKSFSVQEYLEPEKEHQDRSHLI